MVDCGFGFGFEFVCGLFDGGFAGLLLIICFRSFGLLVDYVWLFAVICLVFICYDCL